MGFKKDLIYSVNFNKQIKENFNIVKQAYKKFSPDFPIQAHFLDSEVEMMYYDVLNPGM